jgi:hypothetical protein
MPIIPTSWEAEIGGSRSKTGPEKKHEPLSKRQTKKIKKGLGCGSSDRTAA